MAGSYSGTISPSSQGLHKLSAVVAYQQNSAGKQDVQRVLKLGNASKGGIAVEKIYQVD